MDLRDTPEQAEFRATLRAWIDANLPEEKRGSRGGAQRFDDPFMREWSRKLYEAGYAGLTWPKEYGGGARRTASRRSSSRRGRARRPRRTSP